MEEAGIIICPGATEALCDSIKTAEESFCRGLHFSARWFVLSGVFTLLGSKYPLFLIVMPDKDSAEYCCGDLYNMVEGDRVFFLPDSGAGVERSNYKSSLSVQRTSSIEAILDSSSAETRIVVTYPGALCEQIPSRGRIKGETIKLTVGECVSFSSLQSKLFDLGFEKVDFVSSPGQYAIRGSIVDIFSYSNNYPYRISFFGDEIEKINTFDCNTQLSKSSEQSADIVSSILSGGSGDNTVSILSELPSDTLVWLDNPDMYKDQEFYPLLSPFRKVYLDVPLGVSPDEVVSFDLSPQPVFRKNFDLLNKDIREKIIGKYRVVIFGEKKSQLDRLRSILGQSGVYVPEFREGFNIHSGFIDNESMTCCYCDHEIFERFHRVAIRRSVEKTEQLTLNDLSSFNIGDYIVHIDYGVGIFGGLVRMKDDKGRMHEVVKLMYKDGDVVFISVHSLHKISRFKSKEADAPRINKLGSRSWQVMKASAKSKVKDIAKDLIKLYAERKASQGFAYSPDTYLQEELESSFMYEDTPDQVEATRAVKRDMEESSPMDRLICGDVGFGKTEIAIRAAFKAVTDNKQVVVLVPTTILALQHYKTFKSRLENFPCNIEYVSRLRTAKEINQIRESVKSGRTNIVIGTHKVLGKNFEFKDLGLLIIDEEQKFGVGAKEKLRTIKQSVDTLTLTATPIPRTLQFSLLGARDLSVISTPPPNRIPVQTEVILFNKQEIKSIIDYELNRGGQIFFLHNRVEELESIHDILSRLVPDMKICVAHGQMDAKVLEQKMLDFMEGDYDMLLCTSIIENGLDIPNANTIIINQAQNFGLSDLHQLRGRVGRSNRKAFCYMIVPPLVTLTNDARKRLKAIEEFSDLGSGFSIAMQDLDIRGAGNLLGAEQSGFISDMGYETYQKILSEAMDELGVETGLSVKNIRNTYVDDCTIETDQEALIPDSYIDITAEKMRIYRELDSITRSSDLDILSMKLVDRFGPMPREVESLFDIVRIRNLAERIGFEKVIIKNGIIIAFFLSNQNSPYYSDGTFDNVLRRVVEAEKTFELNNKDNRLRVISRGINSTREAYSTLLLLSSDGYDTRKGSKKGKVKTV